MTMSLILPIKIGLGCCVWKPLDISLVLLLSWVCPALHRQAPLVEGFFIIVMDFFPGLAFLYELSGIKDYKVPHALIGLPLACIYGTQHWDAMQYTHNHACSITVHILHTRVVTVWKKQFWFLDDEEKDLYNQFILQTYPLLNWLLNFKFCEVQ